MSYTIFFFSDHSICFSSLHQSVVSEYDNTSALADIAQHIVSSHMALTNMTTSQAEIAYIHLAQQMDGCGVEYAKATVSLYLEGLGSTSYDKASSLFM